MENPIVNLEKLSEPVTKLIESLSGAIGKLYAPFGTVRQAKANATAMIIKAEAEAEIKSIEHRAMSRLEFREAARQENIESIAVKAVAELPNSVSADPVDKNWMMQFLDSSQDVSDEQMQTIWAKILAGEVASPGSYSKRTLRFLQTLEKWEAEKFSELCRFAVSGEDGWNYLIEHESARQEIDKAMGNFDYIGHFIAIGLLSSEQYFPSASSLTGRELNYFDEKYVYQGPPKPPENGKFPAIELVMNYRNFSLLGQQLAGIAGAQKVPGLIDRISSALEKDLSVKIERR